MNTTKRRAIGCLVGLAVGDALGTTLEFCELGSFEPIDDMIGGGPFNLAAGLWTDDTSMALCLAESLLECRGFNLEDQARRYIQWWQHGHLSSTGHCFDIGNTISAALSRFIRTGDPESGGTGAYSAGNGSIMRLAPIPIFFDDPRDAIFFAGKSSITTHKTAVAIDACRYFAGVLHGLLDGASKEDALSKFFHPSGEPWSESSLDPAIARIAAGSFKEKHPPSIRGSGYVAQSLEAALWAFHNSESFREGALKAVNLGEDADTTGAVYGQLAGAFYGIAGIPKEWLERLHGREMIEDFALRLLNSRASPNI
jgi:ADP-ribosyl-[dinitrogen reductase] hydrolase